MVHFGLILATVLPEDAVWDPLQGAAERYVDPLFRQEWSLFAPDPLDGDVRILVRAKVAGNGPWTEWTDIYRPLLRHVRGRPFSPGAAARVTMLRSALVPLKLMFYDRDTLSDRQELFRQWQQPDSKPAEITALERTASQAMGQVHPDRDLESVQVRLILTLLPDGRTRGSDRRVPLQLTLPAVPYEPAVSHLGLR